ncbi:hypothetical protein GCK72_019425 [Caenorhabditis remanei]|uniref:Uncharacterized protein n=1 Tax=Caenorhabditis remanei TaxID=31234 RepID=A0A6A5GCU1_CAERE|nr:hypothetical protein GCK72_019425 [Caenorhabditis remanei]KAF1752870.1 hypothetical protein GCK72_019425 [Caenorhabditis remanei]
MKVIYAYGDTRSQLLGDVPEVIVIDDDIPDFEKLDDSFELDDMISFVLKGEQTLPKREVIDSEPAEKEHAAEIEENMAEKDISDHTVEEKKVLVDLETVATEGSKHLVYIENGKTVSGLFDISTSLGITQLAELLKEKSPYHFNALMGAQEPPMEINSMENVRDENIEQESDGTVDEEEGEDIMMAEDAADTTDEQTPSPQVHVNNVKIESILDPKTDEGETQSESESTPMSVSFHIDEMRSTIEFNSILPLNPQEKSAIVPTSPEEDKTHFLPSPLPEKKPSIILPPRTPPSKRRNRHSNRHIKTDASSRSYSPVPFRVIDHRGPWKRNSERFN